MPSHPLQAVAALYDIHGNAPALAAVLQEVATLHATTPIDALVIGGDTVSGPLPAATLQLLASAPWPLHWIRGNADREVVAAWDAQHDAGLEPDPAVLDSIHPTSVWAATHLNRAQRDLLATAAPSVVLTIAGLGAVCCCHGSPRSDEESITRNTSDERLRRILHATPQPVVLCGHTHVQFDRTLDDRRIRVINAGSVGSPYQDAPGAYWALLGPFAGPTHVALRHTPYPAATAATAMRNATPPMPNLDDFIRITLFEPVSAEYASERFEQQALEREAAEP